MSETTTVEVRQCAGPHCTAMIDLTRDCPQVDLPREAPYFFHELRCLALWAHERMTPAAPRPPALCRCGHSRASHQPDTGECWGFVIDADSQYCRCPEYVEGGRMMQRYPPRNDDVSAMVEILEFVGEHGTEYAMTKWNQRAEALFDAWYGSLDLVIRGEDAE